MSTNPTNEEIIEAIEASGYLMEQHVATSGVLLTVDSMKPNPVPEPKDWVSFSRELKSGKLSGTYGIDFVCQHRLETFVRECIDPLGQLSKELVETRTDFLLGKL